MKKIATLVLLTGCFLGAACSPEAEAPKSPVAPSATMKPATDPALSNADLRNETKNTDVATAIIPADKTEPLDTASLEESDASITPTPTP